jgi:hypothetical protein
MSNRVIRLGELWSYPEVPIAVKRVRLWVERKTSAQSEPYAS